MVELSLHSPYVFKASQSTEQEYHQPLHRNIQSAFLKDENANM
jgi:hypothetical protein